MTTQNEPNAVAGHYGGRVQLDTVLAAVRQALPADRPARVSDLAALDQFHARGQAATEELAQLAGVRATTRVVDLGAGLGGPARHLAAHYGCRVTGIDLTPDYCRIATKLTEIVGLTDQVEFQTGDVTALPFADGQFDLAWTQHVVMNVADRRRFYSEANRVLVGGGRFAMYDVVEGNGEDIKFPVPWSGSAANSFLLSGTATKEALEACGFDIVEWRDVTAQAIDWFEQRRPPEAGQPLPALGLHLLLGPEGRVAGANYLQNLREGRVGVVMAVARKR